MDNSNPAFSAMKVPLKAFIDLLRSPTTLDQKTAMFPLVSTFLKQKLNNDPVDMEAFTGHQLKILNDCKTFFGKLSGISALEEEERAFLGKVFSEVGDCLKAGRSPYIVGGESSAIYSKDFPDDDAFVFSASEKQKISRTREFLDKNTDGALYHEKLNTIPKVRIFGGKTEFVRYHLFILEKQDTETRKVEVNF